jgi:hypothetical protein
MFCLLYSKISVQLSYPSEEIIFVMKFRYIETR